MATPAPSPRPAHLLAGLLTLGGLMHFVKPKPYDAQIPASLPGSARTWTYASGVAEIGVAAAIAAPRTRRLGGLAAALLFVAIFPANVKMAVDAQRKQAPAKFRAITLGRLPLQWPLVAWSLKVRDSA
ncbi:hypothetical protein [Amycolatopsis sp. NPDC051128]|uniref:DoxX family protein n=1 Tax=Amycolatopsis sp. NPDC051128 TaxID=3155412 RepID=UPI0034150D88